MRIFLVSAFMLLVCLASAAPYEDTDYQGQAKRATGERDEREVSENIASDNLEKRGLCFAVWPLAPCTILVNLCIRMENKEAHSSTHVFSSFVSLPTANPMAHARHLGASSFIFFAPALAPPLLPPCTTTPLPSHTFTEVYIRTTFTLNLCPH